MTGRRVRFTGERSVGVQRFPVPEPDPGTVRVRTTVSAISPGTEGLLYRGDVPTELRADETIDALDGDLSYPLTYGYAAVGRVTAVGDGVDEAWLDRRVFAYNPHESHFVADPDDLLPVPDAVDDATATLLATAETAVTFVLDGAPLLGERVVVFGQGIVGLVTTALLAETSVETLLAVEPIADRREQARSLGADRVFDPHCGGVADRIDELTDGGVDLGYELSGDPDALDAAVSAARYDGRVLVGSWYGTTPARLDLGGRFHRDRIDVYSSQVSTIDPELRGRWTRTRRHEVAWRALDRLDLSPVAVRERPIEDAPVAFRTLETRPGDAVQVLLTYE